MEEHRALTAEKFTNRADYVEMSAFGVGYRQRGNAIEGFDNKTVAKLLNQATGFGKLNAKLYKLNHLIENLMYRLAGQSIKYDFALVSIIGDDL